MKKIYIIPAVETTATATSCIIAVSGKVDNTPQNGFTADAKREDISLNYIWDEEW